MPERANHGGAVSQPLTNQVDRVAANKSTDHPNGLVGPCRIGRKHVYFPFDNPDGKLGLKLANKFFNYLRNRCL